MAHPIWPLFDLTVTTPRLELRFIDDTLGPELAELAARGIHDPAVMPFGIEWTDVPPPQLQRNSLQWYWNCRATWQPNSWRCEFVVLVDGEVVGSTSLFAEEFAMLRRFETGSWLGRAHQGKGLGKEMRAATLHLGFAGLGAQLATTTAYADNGASLGVTRSLGYEANGSSLRVRRGQPAEMLSYQMQRSWWEENLRRDDITIDGLEPCLTLFGV